MSRRNRNAAGSRLAEALSGHFGMAVMALVWAAGWGLGLGGLMEVIDPSGEIADIWFTVLGIPGFITGALFWVVLRIGEKGRRFDLLSPGRVAAWGAVTGGIIGLLLFSVGFARPQFDGLWLRSPVLIGGAALLCALSAAVLNVTVRGLGRRRDVGSSATA